MLDQHGMPIQIPSSLRSHFETTATASLQLGVTDSSTLPDPHSAQEYNGSELSCKLSSWVWGETDPLRGVLHSSVMLTLPAGVASGPALASLTLAVDPNEPHTANIPAHIHSFSLLLPVNVGEYRAKLASNGVAWQSASQTAVTTGGGDGPSLVQLQASVVKPEQGLADSHMCIMLSCEENHRLVIVLSLKAFDGSVARDTAFSVREVTFPGLESYEIRSRDGQLEIQLQVGAIVGVRFFTAKWQPSKGTSHTYICICAKIIVQELYCRHLVVLVVCVTKCWRCLVMTSTSKVVAFSCSSP